MKTDYFSDLLPDSVTSVTSNKPQAVTPAKEGNKPENSDLQEALPVLPVLPGETGNTEQTEARRTLKAYRYRLRDCPASELILIAPGTDLAEATEGLKARFGDRLIDVKAYEFERHTLADDGVNKR